MLKSDFFRYLLSVLLVAFCAMAVSDTAESTEKKVILVSGATGNQGGAVTRELLKRGYHVRGLTRNPDSERARVLAGMGVEVVKGDFEDPASLERALVGAYGAFSMQDYWEHGYDAELLQGRNFADAAKKAGVRHFVYSTAASVDKAPHIPQFETKAIVEKYLHSIGLPYTVVRPVSFMTNFEYAREEILSGTFADALSPQTGHQYIAVSDIGRVVAEIFGQRDKWVGRTIEIAGDEKTMAELMDTLSDVTGRPVKYVQQSWEEYEEQQGADMTVMQKWFESDGYTVDIAALREEFPWLLTLEEYLLRNGWNNSRDWTVHSGDKKGTRYSLLQQITPDNVDDLEVAWQYRTGERERRGEKAFEQSKDQSIPLLVAGNLIICTPFNRIIALDPAGGDERWVFDPGIALDMQEPPTYGCRGVAYWRDDGSTDEAPCRERLLFGTNDLRMFAIDAKTGKRCAEFGDDGVVALPPSKPELFRGEVQYAFPPIVVNGVVVLGSTIADNQRIDTPSGKVQALSAKTGEKLWEFEPIPRSPDNPAYATWGNDSALVNGSANTWSNMAADEERDMVFLPVSTPAPDNYGGTRPGNNEYANSLVALRASTGEMIWHYQILHHSIWDYDLAPQPLLVDLPRDGEMVPVVVQNTKQGLIFIFHRETGEPFFPIEERPVPQGDVPGEWYSPTQPFPVKPPPLIKTTVTPDDMWGFTFWDKGKCREVLETLRYGDIYTPPSLQGSVINPWTGGGANWGGPAFDPERGLMIINTSRVMKVSKLVPIEEADKDTKGDDFHYGPAEKMHGTPYAIKDQLFVSPWGAPCNRPPWGGLTAVNLAEGTFKWDVPLGSIEDHLPLPIPWNLGVPNIGGPIITASGLIFIAATMDQVFRAFDIETGEELWRDKLPATTMTTPMTYQVNGRQYIAVVSGGHGEVPSVRGDYVLGYALPAD